MGWAEKLPSGRYRAAYRDAEGHKRSAGTFPRKGEAVRAAGNAETGERDAPTPQGAARLTWSEWEPQWLAGRTRAASTSRSDAGRIEHHLRPQWGTWALRDVTTGDVTDWLAELERNGLAPSTVQKCYFLLSSSMKAAVAKRILTVNPCKGVVLPKPGPGPDRYLEDAEYNAIRVSLDDFDQFASDLLVGSGLRLGEALALHWEDVDLAHNAITVEWAYDPVARILKEPKDYQRRTVPVGSGLARMLRAQLEQTGAGEPPAVERRGSRVTRTGLVLAHTGGNPMDSSNYRHRWEASARIAYTGAGKNRRAVGRVRLHDLRHTYASRLLRSGVPIEEVKDLMGHASIVTTMRYKHLAQSHWETVRRALG